MCGLGAERLAVAAVLNEVVQRARSRLKRVDLGLVVRHRRALGTARLLGDLALDVHSEQEVRVHHAPELRGAPRPKHRVGVRAPVVLVGEPRTLRHLHRPCVANGRVVALAARLDGALLGGGLDDHPRGALAALADDPDDRKGRLKNIGGSQSDHWNNTLANQAVQALWMKNSSAEERDKQLSATVAALIGIAPKDER